jgi:hypothetical protein
MDQANRGEKSTWLISFTARKKLSRQKQLEANPTTIVHFCKANRPLNVGHRAVLMGKQGEVLTKEFVIGKSRVCKPEEVTEEFACAPDIANSLEKRLCTRIRRDPHFRLLSEGR